MIYIVNAGVSVCGRILCFVLSLVYVTFQSIMADFGLHSLEEEDCNEFFITQEPSGNGEGINNGQKVEVGGENSMDVGYEVGKNSDKFGFSGDGQAFEAVFSDISDPDDYFVNPPYGRVNE